MRDVNFESFLQENGTEIHLAISVCQQNLIRGQGYPENDRQFRQLKVLLKSVGVLAKTRVKFHIITDSHDVYQQITNVTLDWSSTYRNKIAFGLRKDLYNPPDMESIRNLYRPCASQRMFLPYSFPNTDAMIYTDTDAYFMQPPELMWDLFKNFDHRQVIGVTAHLFQYTPPFNAFPVFGFTGLNSGVLLLNLTRIRNFPNGWIKSIKDIINNYKNKYHVLDQDILNILLSKDNAKYAYEVPCEWNYMFIMCNYVRNTCPSLYTNGLALLHGVDWSFINEKGPKFKAVFYAWEKYDMKSPVEELLTSMRYHLREAPLHACGKVPNIDDLIMKGIKKHLP
ncbi:hypothetical protein SK128_006305 [Halocaridina rubra]|uniref:UDP-D-xylose:beta-D-glucoside alpha-1,3-D-xylosyltransferase n=1 Tax=Halocaridina rubra TaxID=373956 RepID=A0AAN9A065_HALRR